MNLFKYYDSSLKYKVFQIVIIILIASIIINPSLALNSARDGLNTWFNILLPSLLPFFILSELFILSGFVESFGKLLQPIMKPVFNVPGPGAFPLIMSIVSGYPVGAKLSSRLRQENIISKTEGNRLITFTSTSGPLFILGAVLIGMLNSPDLSMILLLPHYLGILTLGLIFKFYKFNSRDNHNADRNSSFNMKNREDISISKLISNSVMESMNSILLVGGFVIIYNVVIELLLASKFTNYIILSISRHFNINSHVVEGIFAGLIELTAGCKKVAILNIDLFHKVMIINFLIAWGGLSILSQAMGFIGQTDLNIGMYIFSKFLHGIFSCIYTYIIYVMGFYKTMKNLSIDAFIMENKYNIYDWIHAFFGSTKLAIGICIYFVILSIFVHLLWNKKEA